MYNKEELEKKTRDEVRQVAKELRIRKWSKMSKAEMIDEIIKASIAESHLDDRENTNKEKVNNMVDGTKCPQNATESENDGAKEVKLQYFKNIEKGTIVAFKVNVFGNVKVKSAAVENVSQKRQMLKLKTKYGREFVIPFSDVIWVRTNNRWPKGVYELLKGVSVDDKKRKEQE